MASCFFYTRLISSVCHQVHQRKALKAYCTGHSFLPTFSLPGMDGWVSLFDISLLQKNPVLVQFHAFSTTLQLWLGFALLSNSFPEESVKIMHLTYAKVVVGGSKNSPRKEQIIIALQESYMWSSCNGT